MDKELQDYKKFTECVEWSLITIFAFINISLLGYTIIPEKPFIYQIGILCSLLAISVYYILKHKQNTKENALYDLFKKYGYIKVNKTTTIIATKEQLQKLATTNDYIELIELNKGVMDLPNRYESAQKILLENPDLKQITRKEVSITYPKLHQKYQKIITSISQQYSQIIIKYEQNNQKIGEEYEFIKTN